jgi:hypothetical protein
MIQTRIVVRPTRSVRDIYRGRKYRVVARFPGGREIDKGFAETRRRAFVKARVANTPQTSPTAGAPNFAPDGGYSYWKRFGENDIIVDRE